MLCVMMGFFEVYIDNDQRINQLIRDLKKKKSKNNSAWDT